MTLLRHDGWGDPEAAGHPHPLQREWGPVRPRGDPLGPPRRPVNRVITNDDDR
jgi:hypothetical protein